LSRHPSALARLAGFVAAGLLLAAGVAAQAAGSTRAAPFAPPRVCDALSVSAATLQKLAFEPVADKVLRLVLDGAPCHLELEPVELRAPGYRLLERRSGALQAVEPGPVTTFRGVVRERPGSRVALNLDGGSLRALVIDGDACWAVQPLRDVDDRAGPELHAVYRGADVLGGAGHCGVAALAAAVGTSGQPDAVFECELALEADHALYLANISSAVATQTEVLGIVNAVDVIYQSDLDVAFLVNQLIVDVLPDPYTTSVASQLLAQMRGYWNANYTTVARDVAHLFSGRSIGAQSGGTVGIAYPSSVCDLPNAYGLSQTRWSANYALRVGLTAHEFGHNFGATHCDLQPGCSLMCSGIGGCSGVTASFGGTALTEMNAYLQSVGCLTLVPSQPQIVGASPSLVPTVAPPVVTLTGSGFLGTTQVAVGSQPLPGGFQVLSDSQVTFTPPAGLPLGVHTATVTNPVGTSNATFLIYQGSDPCRIVAPLIAQGNAPFTWRLGGMPNGTGYLGVSLVDASSPFQGFPVLTQFLTLWTGSLDARGMATVTVPQVPALLSGYPFYSQMIDGVSGTGNVGSVSLVYRTLVL
ncbi:MAG: hypothetical protein KAI24_20390, partial [Planctomycetes bacterium]|nr:hypothetical protein [Planctomycetota bacterium]